MLIDKYRGDKSPLSLLDRYKNTTDYLRRLNCALKNIVSYCRQARKKYTIRYFLNHNVLGASHIGNNDRKTRYTERTVAAALGHEAKKVTDIYIVLESDNVDAANRWVIDYVLYGKE